MYAKDKELVRTGVSIAVATVINSWPNFVPVPVPFPKS